jgi:hypothetical protein
MGQPGLSTCRLVDGKLLPLERQTPSMQTKLKAMGMGGGQGIARLNGRASPTRVAPSADFVVRLNSQGDPSLAIALHRLEQKGDSRQILLVDVGAHSDVVANRPTILL